MVIDSFDMVSLFPKVMRELLEAGADPNIERKNETVLHYLAEDSVEQPK